MTVEAILTRRLGITFIDARAIATEAKLALQIHGYPTDAEKEMLVEEALKIYEQTPEDTRDAMRSNLESLEQSKYYGGLSASSLTIDSTGESSESSL